MQLLRNPQVATHSSCRAGQSRSRPVVVCKAAAQQLDATSSSRRDALLQYLTIASFAVAGKAQAVCADLDTAEEGDACRQAELASDEGKNYKGNYSSLTSGPARKTAANVPVGNLGPQYAQDTRDLADKIDTYITIDVYDKKRQGLIKQLKSDALTWVSKYIAADAVLGHLASNGLAPLPSNKAKTVRQVISEGLAFLDEGR